MAEAAIDATFSPAQAFSLSDVRSSGVEASGKKDARAGAWAPAKKFLLDFMKDFRPGPKKEKKQGGDPP